MSFAIAHFSIGVAFTLSGLYIYYDRIPQHHLYYAFAGGLFAMLPDSQLLINIENLTILTQGLGANIFFGHQFVDIYLDPTNSVEFASGMVFCMCLVVFLSYLNQTEAI